MNKNLIIECIQYYLDRVRKTRMWILNPKSSRWLIIIKITISNKFIYLFDFAGAEYTYINNQNIFYEYCKLSPYKETQDYNIFLKEYNAEHKTP